MVVRGSQCPCQSVVRPDVDGVSRVRGVLYGSEKTGRSCGKWEVGSGNVVDGQSGVGGVCTCGRDGLKKFGDGSVNAIIRT